MLDPEGHKRKTARNRRSSREMLDQAGIEYTVHDNGAHLVIEGNIDFWPETGKWVMRDSSLIGSGVFPLINILRSRKVV